jgi:hypothetical protein
VRIIAHIYRSGHWDIMPRPTLCILVYLLVYLTLAAAPFGIADAGVGDMSGGVSSSGRLSLVQTVQSGDCWYDNGWNGPGYYPCGDEWNSRPDVAGSAAPIIIPAFRRHHHHAVVAHPQARNPIYPVAPSPGPRARPSVFGGASGQRRFGAAGAHTPNFRPGAATVAPGFAGGGFHSGLGEPNLHRFHGAGVPRVGGPVSPGLAGAGVHGFAGAGRFHGGGFGVPHIGAPASPGFMGGAGLHGLGGAKGVHIGGPVSPGFSGVGTFHTGGGAGAHHIGAPGLPGVHGVGAGGVGGFGHH